MSHHLFHEVEFKLVTKENVRAIARWCGGAVVHDRRVNHGDIVYAEDVIMVLFDSISRAEELKARDRDCIARITSRFKSMHTYFIVRHGFFDDYFGD